MKRTNILPTLAALAIGITSSHAAITVLNNANLRPGSAETAYTLSFDPGASATAIVVAVVTESPASTAGDIPVTFNSVPLIPVLEVAGARGIGFYYLNNPATGGAFDLTVDYTNSGANNGQAFAVVSLDASDLITPTTAVADVSAGGGENLATLEVSLTVPTLDSFVLAAFNTNGGAATGSANSPLLQLFGGDQGSLGGAAGYLNGVAAGAQTYSFTTNAGGTNQSKRAAAVAFNVVPEPSAAILGLAGTLLLLRRRRFA